MQPKSSATVVVVFPGTCPVRSISAATDVIAASVVRGRISGIAATVVVFPTPKPPAMPILTGVGGRRAPAAGSPDGFKSTDDPFDHIYILEELCAGSSAEDVPDLGEVGHQHPCNTDVQAEYRGNLGHRLCLKAQRDDVAALEG